MRDKERERSFALSNASSQGFSGGGKTVSSEVAGEEWWTRLGLNQ
jgi:hypothetical protein